MSGKILAAVAALLLAAPALAMPARAAGYEAQLDPAPFDASTRAIILGCIGQATADLQGNTLTIKGTFKDLTSNATAASVRIGLAKAVPGDAIGTLTVTHAKQGEFSGTVKLNAAQIAALKRQSLYIRIDSEKAPDGNLQGWLEETGAGHES
jgi:hypothetical protein